MLHLTVITSDILKVVFDSRACSTGGSLTYSGTVEVWRVAKHAKKEIGEWLDIRRENAPEGSRVRVATSIDRVR